MANRIVTKALAGIEDLLLGTGVVNQVRNDISVPINKIDAAGLIYENVETLRTRFGKKVEVLTNVAALQALATTTVAETFIYLLGYTTAGDGGGGLFWLDSTDTTTTIDNNIVFSPDILANGRWKRVDTDNYMSIDRGDADYTIQAFDFGIQQYATALTADRTVTLPTTGLYKGKRITVIRTALGSFNLAIGTITTLTGKGLVELQYDGTGTSTWIILSEPASTSSTSGDTFNGSFEIDENNNGEPDNWALVPLTLGTIAIDSTDQIHGANSLKFTSGNNGGGSATSERFDVVSGDALPIKFNYKSSVVDSLNTVKVNTYDAAGLLVSTLPVYSEGAANPTNYEARSGTVLIDTTAVTAEIVITGIDTTSTTKSAGTTTHFDNILVIKNAVMSRGALVYLSSTQAVANSLVLPFDAEEYDTDGIHDNVVNNTRLTVPAGVTRVKLSAFITWSGGGSAITGPLQLTMQKGGAFAPGLPRIDITADIGAGVGGPYMQSHSTVLHVLPGDYFEVTAFESVTATMSAIGGTGVNTWFAMEIVG